MVLIRALALLVIAGCGESLFDAHGDRDGGSVPAACGEPCLADAAADFDGTPGGAGNRWRYLDDHRDRTWAPMTAAGKVMTGADADNRITSCDEQGSAAACDALPGALLISAAGTASAADPAIEFTSATAQVVQLTVRVHVPAGSATQLVRIYRNSREDVLATAEAAPGATLDRALTLDALAGDRFLVALTGARTEAVGVHVFVTGTPTAFPSQCKLAASFSGASGTTIDNLCGTDFTSSNDTAAVPPTLAAGPFAEQGMAADFTPDHYYSMTERLVRTGDTTIQLWVRHDATVDPYGAWVFSDYDLDATGGLGIVIYDDVGLKLEAGTCTGVSPLAFEGANFPYPADHAWHFIRVVHSGDTVSICLDGAKMTSFPAPAGSLGSTYPVHLGKNVRWTPAGSFFDGSLDDVRVLATALPCD